MDYTGLSATATRLITEHGRDVTLRSYTIGTYDPATGANTATSSDATVKAALFDFRDGQTEVAGTLIQAGDKKCLMAATVTPELHDRVIVGAKDYGILSIKEVNPAGTVVVYQLHLRAD